MYNIYIYIYIHNLYIYICIYICICIITSTVLMTATCLVQPLPEASKVSAYLLKGPLLACHLTVFQVDGLGFRVLGLGFRVLGCIIAGYVRFVTVNPRPVRHPHTKNREKS